MVFSQPEAFDRVVLRAVLRALDLRMAWVFGQPPTSHSKGAGAAVVTDHRDDECVEQDVEQRLQEAAEHSGRCW